MDPKPCCNPNQKCVAVNKYYSKCDAPESDFFGAISNQDACPGLDACPTSEAKAATPPVVALA